jgi:hypothetical protein
MHPASSPRPVLPASHMLRPMVHEFGYKLHPCTTHTPSSNKTNWRCPQIARRVRYDPELSNDSTLAARTGCSLKIITVRCREPEGHHGGPDRGTDHLCRHHHLPTDQHAACTCPACSSFRYRPPPCMRPPCPLGTQTLRCRSRGGLPEATV